MKRGKQVVEGALIAAALAGGAGSVLAQERDKNWSVTVGLKVWQTQWDTFLSNQDESTGNNNNISLTGAKKFSLIPNLGVRYKDFFVSANHFIRRSYLFEEISIDGKRINPKAYRSETDFNLGWFVVPQLALTVGYKMVKLEHETSYPDFPAATTSYTTKYGGFTVGGFASAPIGGGFAIYINGSGGPTKAKRSNGGTYDGWYWGNELGIAYGVAKGAVLTLGTKQQSLSTWDSRQTGRDVTSGLVFGANYTF